MQLLKVFVVTMALVILVGIGVLAYGMAHHWNKLGGTAEQAAAPAAPLSGSEAAPARDATATSATPYAITVPAPAGMHLEQMSTAGSRALLRFTGPQGDRIVVVDPSSGRVTGTISVPPAGQ
jgi:hypothetical protein